MRGLRHPRPATLRQLGAPVNGRDLPADDCGVTDGYRIVPLEVILIGEEGG
jgi:hypothetical protein